MFERFTDKARAVVQGAQAEAAARRASAVRSEHLLAALVAGPENLAQTVLTGHDVDQVALLAEARRLGDGDAARPDDAEVLATLGIDLDEVRRQVEDAFGPGALERTRAAQGRDGARGWPRWDRSAKKVLELSLREALRLRHNYIGTEHVLLGLLHPGTGAAQAALAARGVNLDSARVQVAELVRRRAAG